MPQLFGQLHSRIGKLEAMICIDSDLKTEAAIHWWEPFRTNPRGAVISLDWNGSEATISTKWLLEPDPETGEMRPINVRGVEGRTVNIYYGKLRENEDKSIAGEWSSGADDRGRFDFSPYSDSGTVQAQLCESWDEFKAWATLGKKQHNAQLFRGHGSSNFRLATTFHRQGRARLERYCATTLQSFRLSAEAVMGMRLDLRDSEEYGVVLGLAQHHGLPTPLLDWTMSPYVAAFFAFSDALEFGTSRSEETHVRVYALTADFVQSTAPHRINLPSLLPYASMLSISARHNPRLQAQQGCFMVTNIEKVEDYLCELQSERKRPFVIAADIPIKCAREALEDLAYMGLTPATLFPGLDGVCKTLKHQMMFSNLLPAVPPSGSSSAPPSSDPRA